MKVTHGWVNLQHRCNPDVALDLLIELPEILGTYFQIPIIKLIKKLVAKSLKVNVVQRIFWVLIDKQFLNSLYWIIHYLCKKYDITNPTFHFLFPFKISCRYWLLTCLILNYVLLFYFDATQGKKVGFFSTALSKINYFETAIIFEIILKRSTIRNLWTAGLFLCKIDMHKLGFCAEPLCGKAMIEWGRQ